jgi:hypothetical protein
MLIGLMNVKLIMIVDEIELLANVKSTMKCRLSC